MTDAPLPNSLDSIASRAATVRIPPYRLWTMLFSRLVLFAACQALFAVAFTVSGAVHPWGESVRWWPVSATLANFIGIGLLFGMTRAEGISVTALYNWNRPTWKRDSLLFLGAFIVLGPLTLLPSSYLALALWGDVNATTLVMFQALPLWAVVPLFVLFPFSVAFSELPTYIGYVMPRLQVAIGSRVAVVTMVAAVLALQHAALPLVFDWRFATWRALMYALFALFVAWALDRRPTLMPYFMGMHVLLDASIPIYVLLASTGKL